MSYINPEIGDNLTVEVTRIHPEHGIFVKTPNGISGLIRPHNIAWNSQNRIMASLSVGDMIEAQVKYVHADGNLELNRKVLLKNPDKIEIGESLKGVVEEILDRKLLIRFDGFVALVFQNEISSSFYRKGDKIETIVIDKLIDDKGHFNLKLSVIPYHSYFAQHHTEGETINVNYIKKGKRGDNSYAVVSVDGLFRLDIPDYKFIEPIRSSLAMDILEPGEQLEFVYTGLNENRGTILLDMRPILKGRERARIEQIRAHLSEGDVLYAEVKKVGRKEAQIQIEGTDVLLPISRDELSPNKVIRASDEVFVGERIKVAFVGEDENGSLLFSRRFFVKDKYNEKLYDMSLEELLATMDIHTTRFVGRAILINDTYFFSELMTITGTYSSEEGKLLVDPVNGKSVLVILGNRLRNLVEEGQYYMVSIELAEKERRLEEGTPYMFHIASPNIKPCQNPYKETVSLSFKQHTSPNTNAGMARLLGEVGQNLYTTKKRMFFELLQNADDAAPTNGVKVKLQLDGEYFIMTHDGYAFNKHDFTSITSAARSTKSSNKKKTGYKGIGFKSVFTNSNSVYIKSGGFDFAFDKSLDIYNRFDDFYFQANEMENDPHRQAAFLKKFAPFRANFGGVKDIPWQLLPVWTEGPSIEEKDTIFYQNENVAIALHMDRGTLAEYNQAIDEVFSEPRFMLFLRNTNRIQLMRGNSILTIQKNLSEDGRYISLVNSFKEDKRSENYKVYTLDSIQVNDEAFAEAGVPIQRKEKINNRGDKENYFAKIDASGQELAEVPEVPDRITSATETTLSLAVLLDENGHVQTLGKEELSFYAFLPMNEQRFKFPFFINADFIPKSDREGVQSDNPWNYFLFFNIGKAIVSMVVENASVEEKDYLNLLPTKELETSSQDTSQLADSFNRGYKQALSSLKFILNDIGELAGTGEIIVDDSKLAEFIGHDGYYSIVCTKKRLPNAKIDSKILSHAIFGVERTTVSTIVNIINGNPERVLTWVTNATEESRNKFFEWLTKDKTTTPLIQSVPTLKYGNTWVSYTKASNTERYIITTEKLLPIVDILKKLGFVCSDTILNSHQLNEYLSKQDERKIYTSITASDVSILNFQERLELFNCAKKLDGVGVETVGKWSIFKNSLGVMSPLSRMFAYSESCPEWLKDFMIIKEENHLELLPHLVASDSIYTNIIEPYIDTILTKTDVLTLYNAYSQSWRQLLSLSLINKGIPGILSVVEQSDNVTKEAYVKKLGAFVLDSKTEYSKESNEYRIIKIAIQVGSTAIDHLRSITTVDGAKLLDITLKDEFYVKYSGNEYAFSLSKILPSYSSSSSLSNIAKKFASIPGSEKIFAQREADPFIVKNQLVQILSSSSQLSLGSEQYCFLMMYRRSQGYITFDNTVRPLINITNPTTFKQVLDRCYSGGLGEQLGNFLKDPNVVYPCGKLTGKYIDSDDYTLVSERAPEMISSWADTKEKKAFLLKLGIHDNESQEITRRKSFKNNEYENIWNITDKSTINEFLSWVKASFNLPIVAENQVKILEGLFKTVNGKTIHYADDFSDAKEWTNERYLEWKKNHDLSIFQIPGELPCRGVFNETDFYKSHVGEYVYFSSLKRLYISSDKTPEAILIEIRSDNGVPFSKEDWDSIFMVSASDMRQKDEEIARLKMELEAVRRGKKKDEEAEVEEHGKETDKDNTDERTRIDINREARLAAKDFLESLEDYDSSDWDPEVGTHIVKGLIKYKGKPITVAVLSSRKRKLYLHPRLFADLMEDSDNLLLNYGYDNRIHTLSFDSIFQDNPNVNLIFDTDYVKPELIAGLANKFMNSRKTCFVVENINYSQDEVIKSFGLNEKKQGGTVLTDLADEDIFDFGED